MCQLRSFFHPGRGSDVTEGSCSEEIAQLVNEVVDIAVHDGGKRITCKEVKQDAEDQSKDDADDLPDQYST